MSVKTPAGRNIAAGDEPELAGVTFSDSAPIPKILNPNPVLDPKFFKILDSDSCSNSGNHGCNRNSSMFEHKQ